MHHEKNTTPRAFVPKQDHRIPDAWSITVVYREGGKNDEFEGIHRFIDIIGEKFLEITTIEDRVELILVSEIKKLSFDKRFSLAISIHKELAQKRAALEAEQAKAKS